MLRSLPLLFALVGTTAMVTTAGAQKPIEITFLHTNDLHAHVEPTLIRGKSYGGYARHITKVRELRAKETNVLLLNAGDTFQGTLFFNVYEGLADAMLMNMAGYQAMTLGNHEFDRGPIAPATFAEAVDFPILAANVAFADGTLALKGRVRPSIVLTVDGQRVGVIGAVTQDTPNISSPGAGVTFNDPLPAVQAEADRLVATGVNKIVVLSHVGYEEDQRLAAGLRGVDLIIGGHSHSPLGTPALEGWRSPAGPYPTLVKAADGHSVPIVQAWEWGKVLGRIRIAFDAKGDLVRVVEAAPIVIDETIKPDPAAERLVALLNRPIAAVSSQPVGVAEVEYTDRGLLGIVLADALLAAGRPSGAQVSFINPGGVRANLDAGPITYGEASAIVPFRNTLVLLDLTGAEILAALGQAKLIPGEGAGYKVVGGKIENLILDGAPVDLTRVYRVATLNFLANGGDSVFAFRDAKGRRIDTGKLDIDAFVDYLRANSPLKITVPRIL